MVDRLLRARWCPRNDGERGNDDMKEMRNRFKAWPHYGKEEIAAVTKVLRSGKVNQWTGSEVFAFEKEYAKYLGVKYAIALASGSVALDMALAVLGIKKGDEVIVTPHTFIASASCVALRGAVPVFVDVDRQSGNIAVEAVKKAISRRTKAVIAVHILGWPCEIEELKQLCIKNKIYLIEDCAQAHGAQYNGKPVGSFGDIACFSFCQDKIITTAGEGGLLVTNNKKLWAAAWSFKDHGRDFDTVFYKKHPFGFKWHIKSFGTNYRMTEIQAAVGRVMLKKLDAWVRLRRGLAAVLNEGFSIIVGLRVAIPEKRFYHSYYKYYVYVRPEMLKNGWSRNRIISELMRQNVPCAVGLCPEVYREEAFKKIITGQKRLPIAKDIGETSMMFYVHPRLSKKDMCFVVKKVKKVMKKAVL